MIEAIDLTKRDGDKVAVGDLSLRGKPGRVTRFPGPSRAGKTTTKRIVTGPDAPTAGSVPINGPADREPPAPRAEVGAVLGLLLVLPAVFVELPGSWKTPLREFWPAQAGSRTSTLHHAAHTLATWPGFGLFLLVTAIVVAAVGYALHRKDA